MKRTLLILACLLVVTGWGSAIAGPDPGRQRAEGGNSQPIPSTDASSLTDVVQSVVEVNDQIQSTIQNQSTGKAAPKDGECVQVDIALPDTIHGNPHHPTIAWGFFQLTNCGIGSELVNLSLQVTVHVPGIVDTVFTFPQHTILMDSGQVIADSIHFRVPPFNGSYIFCLTASSGSSTSTDCAAMVVDGVPLPGFPFQARGVLAQGTGCVLFLSANHHPRPAFVLENYGSFVVGDSVFVDGIFFFDCQLPCPEAHGCLVQNIIVWPPPPPPILFYSPGILVQGTNCVLFHPFNTAPQDLFALENYGPFVPGDSVIVSGILAPNCSTICEGAIACVVQNRIEPICPQQFHGPGVLVQGTGCVLFQPLMDSASIFFVLDNYGPFVVGDSVMVKGILDLGCVAPCPEANGCIRNNLIERYCAPPPPPPQFHGPGMLVQGSNCVLFHPFQCNPQGLFVLSNYGSFNPGDTVIVVGNMAVPCSTFCTGTVGCILDNTIEPYSAPPPPPQEFHGPGALVQGFDCLLFSPISGHPMPPMPLLALTNYGAFIAGDTVFVIGQLGCTTTCTDSVGCLDDSLIVEWHHPPQASGFRSQNFPNPFNPSTVIAFDLPAASHVKVSVINMLGQVVKITADGQMAAGRHEVVWDGSDKSGTGVSSGIYFYRIEAGSVTETRKMLLMK